MSKSKSSSLQLFVFAESHVRIEVFGSGQRWRRARRGWGGGVCPGDLPLKKLFATIDYDQLFGKLRQELLRFHVPVEIPDDQQLLKIVTT